VTSISIGTPATSSSTVLNTRPVVGECECVFVFVNASSAHAW